MAQLVARLVRNEKVGGSNPPSSTTGRHPIRMSVFCMPGRGVAVPVVVLLGAPLVFRPPSGPAAREARRPHFVRRRASKPARALRSLRRPPHRRRLWFWCEWPGPATASNRACMCACSGLAAAFRVGIFGECGRIRIGCRYPDVCYLSGCVAAWARWPPCGVATGPASGLRCCSFACNSL